MASLPARGLPPARWSFLLPLLFIPCFPAAVHAAVQVQATRVIYDAKSASAAVTLANKSALPYLVQTWLDQGEDTLPMRDLPMVITPPLMQLAAGEQAVVEHDLRRNRFARGPGIPAWINVQEIPPSADTENVLQVAIRTRIKLFYRPADLDTTLDQASRELQWRIDGQQLQVRNDSPLHITFAHLQGLSTAGIGSEIDLDMIAPGQTQVSCPCQSSSWPTPRCSALATSTTTAASPMSPMSPSSAEPLSDPLRDFHHARPHP